MNNKIFYYTLHRKLWGLIEENPHMSKSEIVEEFFTDKQKSLIEEDMYCFACDYTKEHEYDDQHCSKCPLESDDIESDDDVDYYYCLNGLFDKYILYIKNKELKIASKYAHYIKNLLPKKGIPFI